MLEDRQRARVECGGFAVAALRFAEDCEVVERDSHVRVRIPQLLEPNLQRLAEERFRFRQPAILAK